MCAAPRIKDNTKFFDRMRREPAAWGARFIDSARPWAKQIEIMESVRDNARTCVPAGHCVGKTWIAARTALWFLYCHMPSIVLTTAPTWRQVEKLIWGEIHNMHRNSYGGFSGTHRNGLGGEMSRVNLRIDDLWYAQGVSTNSPERFQGYHQEHLLIIIDEAAGVERPIWEAVEGCLTGPHSRLLAIGNPVSADGPFWEMAMNHNANTIHVSCLDHPNVAKGQLIYPQAISPTWPEEREREWGEDSPIYQRRVLGQFPSGDADMLFPVDWLQRTTEPPADQDRTKDGDNVLAVDVARFGSDRSVLLVRTARAVSHIRIIEGSDLMTLVGRVVDAMKRFNVRPRRTLIDSVGMGAGVVDRLRELGHNVAGVNFGARASKPELFVNLRAECYWRAREAVDPKRGEVLRMRVRHCDVLRMELQQTPYSFDSAGRIKLPPKEHIKSELGRSPDLADALAISYTPTSSFVAVAM